MVGNVTKISGRVLCGWEVSSISWMACSSVNTKLRSSPYAASVPVSLMFNGAALRCDGAVIPFDYIEHAILEDCLIEDNGSFLKADKMTLSGGWLWCETADIQEVPESDARGRSLIIIKPILTN